MNEDIKNIIIKKYKSSPKGWRRWILSKDNRDILEALSQEFINIPNITLREQMYWLVNDLKEYPRCKTCQRSLSSKHFIGPHHGYYEHCCCKCTQLDKEVRAKNKQTCIDRYGVENAAQSDIFKEKYRQTCIDRYGVDNSFKSEDIKNKIKQTCIDRYGVENPHQNKQIKEKAKNTLITKYGITCGFQNGKIKNTSKGENELYEYIKSFYKDAIQSDREEISPLELDIFIPSLKIGIEFDGDYWHSLPDMKRRDNLKNKICKEKNIKLIRVLESEWKDTSKNLVLRNKILNTIRDYGKECFR